MSEIKFNSEEIYQKLNRISNAFSQNKYGFDTVFWVLGKIKPESPQIESSTFHLWLLRYEISETIIALQENKIVVLASSKKCKLFLF